MLLYDLLGCSLGDDLSAGGSSFWAELDQPVSAFDEIEIMLNHDHAVSFVDETVKDSDEATHVVLMKTGRRFVQEEKKRIFGIIYLGEILHQFQALGLASGKRIQRLSQFEVA